MQLKKTQAHVSVWGLLMASQKHCKALLDALNGKEVPIETVIPHIILCEVIIILLFKKKKNCWAIGIFFLLVIAAR